MEKRAANPGSVFAKPRNSEPMEGGVGCLGQSRNITPRAIVGKRGAANMNFLLRLGTLLSIEASGFIGGKRPHDQAPLSSRRILNPVKTNDTKKPTINHCTAAAMRNPMELAW